MASRKKNLVKHCRIYQWVEAKDPDFAGAIRDLCLEGVLSPGKGGGVTFLYPEDAAHRAEIVAKTYSDEADAAVRLVEALIIPEALHKASDFHGRKVGNRLGVPFAVERVSGSRVQLAGGAELAPAGDFSPLERRASAVAVWRLTGRVPTEGSGYAPPARGAKRKTGGAEAGSPHRLAHIAKVAQDFIEWEACRHQGPDPFLAACVGLLHSLGPEELRAVTPFLDYYPHVTLHLLLEPHKTVGEPLLSEAAIANWGGSRVARAGFARDYLAFLSGGPTAEEARRRRAEIERERAPLERSAPQKVFALAHELYGAGAPAAGAADRCRKLWADELRYQFHVCLEALAAPHSPEKLVREMAELCASHPGNDYEGELSILNKTLLESDVRPVARLLAACRFIRSTDFLYQLVPPEAVGDNQGSPQPDDPNLYNPSAVGLAYLDRLATSAAADECLSPRTRRALELYARLHGGELPKVGKPPA